MKFTSLFPSDHWAVVTSLCILYSVIIFGVLYLIFYLARKFRNQAKNKVAPQSVSEEQKDELNLDGSRENLAPQPLDPPLSGIISKSHEAALNSVEPTESPTKLIQCYVQKTKGGQIRTKMTPIELGARQFVATNDENPVSKIQSPLKSTTKAQISKETDPLEEWNDEPLDVPKRIDFQMVSSQIGNSHLHQNYDGRLEVPIAGERSDDREAEHFGAEVTLYRYETPMESEIDRPSELDASFQLSKIHSHRKQPV